MPSELSKPGPERLMSLDVFRGATMASMLLVNNPGDWGNLYSQLDHAAWSGWTFTDLIFPFFLWIVGVAIPLSMGRRLDEGEPRRKAVGRIVRRSAIIIGLGLALNGFPHYDLSTIRIPGVLQRIGVCYLFAALIFVYTRVRGQIVAIVCLLWGYWLLMATAGPMAWNEHGNFSEHIDTLALHGHTWRETNTYDPEGIVSTLPAIASVLFGILTGQWLRSRKNPAEKTAWMFMAANLLLLAGQILSYWMPIIKKLWTDSYSIFMAGMALNIFAICYWLIDVKGHKKWAKPFAIYGTNAITIFVLTGLLGRISTIVRVGNDNGHPILLKTWLFNHLKAGFSTVAVPLATAKNSSLVYALMYVALMYAVAWTMYRRKWFVRL
jgi:predicted acyltransferase